MPCPGRYEDATATYIRRTKVPSHMYAKHQYSAGVRVQKNGGNIYYNKKIQVHKYHRARSTILLLHYERRSIQITRYEQYNRCLRAIDKGSREQTKIGQAERSYS